MLSGIKFKAWRDSFFLTNAIGQGRVIGVVNTGNRAFTLIELLIVVAIIAILAAIAVPNFIEAQTRAKVARVTADMRTMVTGIESYRIDNNKLPVRHENYTDTSANPTVQYIAHADTKLADPLDPTARVGLKMITTPISYLSSVPLDVFNTPIKSMMPNVPGTSDALDYWDAEQLQAFRNTQVFRPQDRKSKAGFALLSVGPDKYMGMNSGETARKYPLEPAFLRMTMRFFYDPSNGTTSAGNVYMFSDSLQQGDFL